MDVFSGECHRGPLNGQRLAHWATTKKFYRPMMAWSMRLDGPVESVEIGEYQFARPAAYPEGGWFWRETEEGRAFRKLFDKDDEA